MEEPELTTQVARYLKEIIDIYDDYYLLVDFDDNKVLTIKSYVDGEKITPKIDLYNTSFWKYLEKIGSIKIVQEEGISKVLLYEVNGLKDKLSTASEYSFVIKDIEKIRNLANKYTPTNKNDYNLIIDKKVEDIEASAKKLGFKNIKIPDSFCPRLSSQGKSGYLQIHTRGNKFRIAGLETRQFKLIRCLFSPENIIVANYNPTPQDIERVFENIKIVKDKNDGLLHNIATSKGRKIQIIENSIKEIQKIKKLQGYLKFEWFENKTKIRLKIKLPEGK